MQCKKFFLYVCIVSSFLTNSAFSNDMPDLPVVQVEQALLAQNPVIAQSYVIPRIDESRVAEHVSAFNSTRKWATATRYGMKGLLGALAIYYLSTWIKFGKDKLFPTGISEDDYLKMSDDARNALNWRIFKRYNLFNNITETQVQPTIQKDSWLSLAMNLMHSGAMWCGQTAFSYVAWGYANSVLQGGTVAWFIENNTRLNYIIFSRTLLKGLRPDLVKPDLQSYAETFDKGPDLMPYQIEENKKVLLSLGKELVCDVEKLIAFMDYTVEQNLGAGKVVADDVQSMARYVLHITNDFCQMLEATLQNHKHQDFPNISGKVTAFVSDMQRSIERFAVIDLHQ